jgi:branched-subunit amino acid transport protein
MMIDKHYLYLVIGMGLVTFIPRWIPLMLLSRRSLPKIIVNWLDLIPAAILSALLVPALVTSRQPRVLDLFQPDFWVALPTCLFAIKTKSLAGTVLLGMFLYWSAQRWIWAVF